MEIIKQGYEIIGEINRLEILKKIEICGRVCYKSEEKITENSSENFVKNIIKRGHESVLEHMSITIRFITDRGVSHEIVRHRIASFSQESTRYCNYNKKGIVFIEPYFFDDKEKLSVWLELMKESEEAYNKMIENGARPNEARSVLPNSLKTELIMTANLREWRHFFKLRTSPAAHPQMRLLVIPLCKELSEKLPEVFFDIL